MAIASMARPRADILRVMIRAEQARRARLAAGVFAGLPPKWRRWSGFADFAHAHLRIVNVRKQLVPFVLNPIQRKVVAAEIRARREGRKPHFIVLKYRKGGISTLEQALAYWTCWREEHQECLTVAHNPDATRLIFRMVARYYENQPEKHRHGKTAALVNHLEFPTWDSIYMAATSGRGGNLTRGQTYSRVHLSEAAFYVDLQGEHTAMAKAIGPESAYVMESTPNGQEGRGQPFYEFYQAAKKGLSTFIPLFLAWHDDPLNVRPFDPEELEDQLRDDEEARELMQRHNLSLAQIAWWLNERRELVADGGSSARVHQEHPSDDSSCFLNRDDAYYDLDLLLAADKRVAPPVTVEDHGRLRIWEIPDEDEPASYAIGADPSGGTGNDDAAAVILNARTRRQAAAYQFDRIPPDLFGERLCELGWRYRNPKTGTPAYLVVERNNHGHATLTAILKQKGYPKDRVYHHTDESKVDAAGNTKPTQKPGWDTNLASLYNMTTILGRTLREGSPVWLDAETVRSIKRVSYGPHGADFSGRDLAVGAALATVGVQRVKEEEGSGFFWINGERHEL